MNKKKSKKLEIIEENRFIEWITNYGSVVLIGIACFLAVVLIGYRFASSSQKSSATDFFRAEKEFAVLQSDSADLSEKKTALTDLTRILQRQPDLHAKYDGLIAQELLNQGNILEAQKYADLALLRTKRDDLPFYADYTNITMMIAKEDYRGALASTQELKQKMIVNAELAKEESSERSFGDVLFAFNLMRSALLNQKIGDREAELNDWRELKQYARLSDQAPPTDAFSPQAFYSLLHQFEEGRSTMLSYIEQREKS